MLRQRIHAVAAITATAFALSAATASAAPTDIDTSFGHNGKALVDAGGDEATYDILMQPDGKAIGSGFTTKGSGLNPVDALVYRVNADGSPDAAFGTRTFDAGGQDYAVSVALQPDGKIVAAGYTTANNTDGVVWRLNADGSPDLSFGNGGSVVIDSGADEYLEDVAITPDGKIVLVGSSNQDIAIYRLTTEGKLDPTFDTDGALGFPHAGNDSGHAVAVQPDGKMLLTGRQGGNFVVFRLQQGGAPDPAFQGGSTTVATVRAAGFDIELQPDGKIVVAGRAAGANDDDALVARLDANGKLDPTFHDEGSVRIDTGSDEYSYSLAIQGDGKIVVGGGVSAGDDALMFRLNGDGSRDARFGENGVFIFSGGLDEDTELALASDGKILLAGDNNATNEDALVWRFLGDFKAPDDAGDQGGGSQGGGDQCGGRVDPPPPVVCNGKPATIIGTAKGDRISGTKGPDVIAGLGGGDRIRGLDGNDIVCGGPGRDVLRGGKGRDVLIGGAGRDKLIGGPGRDKTQQ